MAQDENFVSSSNSAGSGGGDGGSAVSSSHNRSKIAKHKKAPQRGLGVAQLERLRLEEQRNYRATGPANALPNNAIGPAHSPGSVTTSPPSNSNLAPPPPLFRSGPSALNDETGLRAVSSWPRLWAGEFNDHHNYVDEKQRVDHHHHHHHHNVGFAFGPQINLTMQQETNSPVSPFPGGGSGPQWSFQFQRPPSSSVTNVSSGISQSSLSSSQMEPPSIQSVRGTNNYSPSWSEDEKMAVGMKRAYPFNLESPPPPKPSFLANFHASGSRSDEFPSCSNEPRNKYIRDGRLGSPPGPKQIPVEETRLFGDLLSLAPPVAAPPAPPRSLKNKHPLEFFDHRGLDLSDNRSFSSQETMRSSQTHRAGPSTSTEQPFSFFPIRPQTDKTSTHARNGNGDKGETLDLNLKL